MAAGRGHNGGAAMQTVALIQGGGVGFDQQAAVERVLAAADDEYHSAKIARPPVII